MMAGRQVLFGGWPMGGWHWTDVSEDEVIQAARTAVELGIREFDTAPVYGFGLGEVRMGKALQESRSKVRILTKFGLSWEGEGPPFFTTEFEGRPRDVFIDLRPESILVQCRSSLKRLRTDVIDLYQLHFHDDRTDLREVAQVMDELKVRGMIRAWGVCNLNTGKLHQLVDAGLKPEALQFSYSVLNRRAEKSVIPYCVRHGIRFLAYSPLARGILAGSFDAHREWSPSDDRQHWKAARRQAISRAREKLAELAKAYQASVPALLVAWTAAVPGVGGVLTGCRTAVHVRDAVHASVLEISPEDHEAIRAVF